MTLAKSWNSGARLFKSILATVKKMKKATTLAKDKEALATFMLVRTKEEIVSRQLHIYRALTDGNLENGILKY